MTLACGIQAAADGELQLPEPVEQGGALAAGYHRQVCIREPHQTHQRAACRGKRDLLTLAALRYA